MDKKQNSNFVLVEDFNLQALRQAFAEGRLYIRPREKSQAEIREEGICAILQYVSRIDECAANEYRSCIRSIWEQMLRESATADLFFYTRYSRNKGKPNWRRVTAIVFVLQSCGIYQSSIPAVSLHLMMEQTDRRNSIYTGSSMYYPERDDIITLRQLLDQFKKQM